MTAFDLLILSLATWYAAYTLTAKPGPFGLFERFRARWTIGGLLACMPCLSVWVALALYLIGLIFAPAVWIVAVAGGAMLMHRYTEGIMFKLNMSVPPDLFKAFRDLSVRAKRNFNREIRTTVQPKVQRKANELLGRAPGAVRLPFEFGTDRSRRAFFATNGFGRGIPTRRTGAILKAWVVEITRQGQTNYIILTNTAPESKYVYGMPPMQRQIPGHKRTGWKVDKSALKAINDYAIDLLIDVWYTAYTAAMKGKG